MGAKSAWVAEPEWQLRSGQEMVPDLELLPPHRLIA
jgi:hypothetical protein